MTDDSSGDEVRDRVEAYDGIGLFVRRWPVDGAVATLILMHGLGDHSGRYGALVEPLRERRVAVTAFDLRGHGRSQGRRGDAPSLVALLSDVDVVARWGREAMGADLPWFLFGHSMGGLLALLYGVEGGPGALEGVLASAPWLATRAEVPRWKEVVARLARGVVPGLTLSTGIEPEHLSRDPEWVRAYRDDPLVHDRISLRLYDLVGRAQARVEAGGLNLPALFLVPEDDPLVDPAASRRLARREGADLRTFPEFRHEGFGELGRERFARAAVDWILARTGRSPDQNPRHA